MKRKASINPQQQLSNRLYCEMKMRGMTLTDIAKLLGISYIYISSMNSGARKFSGLKIDKQRILAKFLNISMVEFLLMCGVLREEDLISQ